MVGPRKTVLLLQPVKFQAKVWKTALKSQQVDVIEEPSQINFPQIASQLDAIRHFHIGLLLADLGAQNLNAFEVCRWFHEHYPALKLVLTAGPRQKISSTERRFALEQGAEDLLPGFHRETLVPNAVDRVNRILEVLKFHPLEEKALIDHLMTNFQDNPVPAHHLPRPSQLQLRTDVNRIPQPVFSPHRSLTAPKRDASPPIIHSSSKRISSVPADPLLSPSTSKSKPSASKSKSVVQAKKLWVLLVIALLLAAGWWWLRFPQLFLELNTLLLGQQDSETEAGLTTTFKTITDVPLGLFNHGGSATWALIRQQVDTSLQSDHPDWRLRYVEAMSGTPGSGQGIRMLLDGQLDFTESSRPLKDTEYAKAQQRGFNLVQRPVALDGIAVAVHPSLSLPGLTISQLRQIYMGQITNWNQVGGPNLAITPFSLRLEDTGTADFFQESILQQQPFSPRVESVYSTTDAVRQLSKTPGGIYYASAAQVVPQCQVKSLPLGVNVDQFVSPYQDLWVPPERCPQQRNQPNIAAFRDGSYPITRLLFVIIKQNQGREEQVGEAYANMLLTDQGQQMIEQAGFVRVR